MCPRIQRAEVIAASNISHQPSNIEEHEDTEKVSLGVHTVLRRVCVHFVDMVACRGPRRDAVEVRGGQGGCRHPLLRLQPRSLGWRFARVQDVGLRIALGRPSDAHVAKPSVIIDRAGIFLTPVDVGCGRRVVGEVFVTCADARFSPGCLVPVISAAALFRGTALGCVLVLDVSNGYTGKSERNTDLASRAPLRPSLDAALALFLEK